MAGFASALLAVVTIAVLASRSTDKQAAVAALVTHTMRVREQISEAEPLGERVSDIELEMLLEAVFLRYHTVTFTVRFPLARELADPPGDSSGCGVFTSRG